MSSIARLPLIPSNSGQPAEPPPRVPFIPAQRRPVDTRIALAHDYLTQRGGAERVVLDLAAAFPGAPLYTSLYDPAGTFPEFAALQTTTSSIDAISLLRHHHRLALPLLAQAVSRMIIDADVTVASSSGWAHGIRTTGKKIVYCHAPARWLYQTSTYLGRGGDKPGFAQRGRHASAGAAMRALSGPLRMWDRQAAASADRYLVNSTVTQRAVQQAYGIDAEVVPPPPALLPTGPEVAMPGIEPGFVLCVARLLPYKNVDAVIKAVHRIPGLRLVVVGSGPDAARLAALSQSLAGSDKSTSSSTFGPITLAGRVTDENLRWLYRNCCVLAAASIEDYGLTPLEAAAFGKPTVALGQGGYLDTLVDGETGLFFDSPVAEAIAPTLRAALNRSWSEARMHAQAQAFSPARFRARLRQVVEEVLAQ